MKHLYRDRREAGEILAQHLQPVIGRDDAMVVALPRGGVPVGLEVARALDAPMDVLVIRKLTVAGQPDVAIGAIAPDGFEILNAPVVHDLGVTPFEIAQAADRETGELQRWETVYREGRPPLNVRDRTVVIVDDGVVTGLTLRAAITALREYGPRKIVAAVPIGAGDACDPLADEVSTFICPLHPYPFHSLANWYEDFAPLTDEHVCDCLAAANRRVAGIW